MNICVGGESKSKYIDQVISESHTPRPVFFSFILFSLHRNCIYCSFLFYTQGKKKKLVFFLSTQKKQRFKLSNLFFWFSFKKTASRWHFILFWLNLKSAFIHFLLIFFIFYRLFNLFVFCVYLNDFTRKRVKTKTKA